MRDSEEGTPCPCRASAHGPGVKEPLERVAIAVWKNEMRLECGGLHGVYYGMF